MKKRHWSFLNKSTLFLLAGFLAIVYGLLLRDHYSSSIASVINLSNHFHTHLVVVGLLPIYIGTMIFGAIILGLILGRRLETFLKRKRYH